MMFKRKWVTQKVVARLPNATKTLVTQTPSALLRFSLAYWLNFAFRDPIKQGELDFIKQRRILIQVTDIALRFSVGQEKNRLVVNITNDKADVLVAAELKDFMLLAAGKIDPDTLFFRRRLRITGDTELGLAVKNLLDRVEITKILPPFLYRGLLELTEELAEQDIKHPA
ncbi:MAG TPA: SCP2 sterol-binding domain-containing protein [Cellvibrio sp.]|nr:SCP2 sterol-binding domain-containing protein [Cellvibrio sp.]